MGVVAAQVRQRTGLLKTCASSGLEIHPIVSPSMRLANSNPTATVKPSSIKKSMTISPNPAKDFFVISNLTTEIKMAVIYDMQGNKVKEIAGDVRGKSIPVDLSQGLYRVIVKDTDNNTDYNKLIIIR